MMCTPWIINRLTKWQSKVMCKCSYINNEDEPNKSRDRVILPPSVTSSSRGTTPTNRVSSPSSSTSQREVSTTFFSSSSPRKSQSPRRSQVLEGVRSTALTARDEARSGGIPPRPMFLPKLKKGKLKRRVTIGSNQSTSSDSADLDEPDWPPFADEDYIVFCFEEDGEFHVVEESPETPSGKLQCEDHGNVTCACSNTEENKDVNNNQTRPTSPMNRRDCLLPNKDWLKDNEEEMSDSELSPKLQKDRTEDNDRLSTDKIAVRKESTVSLECRNGSVESTDSSQLDWEEQLQDEDDHENSVSSGFKTDFLLPEKMVDEHDIFLSPKSQLAMMITIDDLLSREIDSSSTGSDELCGSSGSDNRADNDDQLEENEEKTSESPKSSVSNRSDNSSSSFEFPVLEWQWSGSPVTWPKSGRHHFKKHKSRRPSLKCCRF